MSEELKELDEIMASHDFWDDQIAARKVIDKARVRRAWVEPWNKVNKTLQDVEGLLELLEEDDSDESILNELKSDLDDAEKELEKLEFKKMLGGEHDINNAFVTIHSGAGGTEACDWVSMLYRMYSRWIENQGFSLTVTDMLPVKKLE